MPKGHYDKSKRAKPGASSRPGFSGRTVIRANRRTGCPHEIVKTGFASMAEASAYAKTVCDVNSITYGAWTPETGFIVRRRLAV